MLLDSIVGELVIFLFVTMPTEVPIQFLLQRALLEAFNCRKTHTEYDIGVPEITEQHAICFAYLLFQSLPCI